MSGVEGLLGLAARARALVRGTERVREAVRGGDAAFVIVAADASDNAKGKLIPLLEANGVPFVERYDRDSLGAAIGTAPVSAIGITGREFAAAIGERMETRSVDVRPGSGH
jgi:ribosomal protein L7Ae-like RNA K-turn-binding protein